MYRRAKGVQTDRTTDRQTESIVEELRSKKKYILCEYSSIL